MTLDDVLTLLPESRPSGDGYIAICPAHDDQVPSLSICTGEDGRILLHCHAGCDIKDVAAALGVSLAHLRGRTISGTPQIAAVYKYRDADGTVLFEKVRRFPKDFYIRHPKPGGGFGKGLGPTKKRVLYRLPELASADPREPVFIAEGEKDADRLAGHGQPATTNFEGAGKWRNEYSDSLRGRHVIILPDNDAPGQKHAELVARRLEGVAASIKVVQLPGLREKEDVSDFLNRGGTISELKKLAEGTSSHAAKCDRPEIIVDTDEHRVNDEAVAALARDPNLYSRGTRLVEVITLNLPPHSVTRNAEDQAIAVPSPARLREKLSACAIFVRDTGEEIAAVHPPQWCVNAVHARGTWPGIRPLEAIVTGPVLLGDGRVLQIPGYDGGSGVLYIPRTTFPAISEEPTHADACSAAAELLDVVRDFPFESPEHRAAWLAALLTPFARHAYRGPTPLMLIDANTRGAGKGLLVSCIATITMGRDVARTSMPKSEDEMRKRITSIVLAAENIVLLDNVLTISSPSLDAALTATDWKDRILGHSLMTETLPLLTTWFATGNNVVLGGDIARRTLHIRLQSPDEIPEERSGFAHPDLLAWLRKEQPRLATAALTVLRAFFVAGHPDQNVAPWGSFEGWSDLVRQAVVWVGQPDPGGTRVNIRDTDSDRDLMELIISAFENVDPRGNGITVSEALKLIDNGGKYDVFARLVQEISDGKPASPKSIGMKLARFRDRVFAGKQFTQDRERSSRGKVWRVVPVQSSATSASCATSNADPKQANHPPIDAPEPQTTEAPCTPYTGCTVTHRCTEESRIETGPDGKTRAVCRICGRFVGYSRSAETLFR
jgi:hypothetical protein